MNIDDLTLKQIKELKKIFDVSELTSEQPLINTRCLIRTYSAGVHIGNIVWQNPDDPSNIILENALRLWKWDGGGLSLSAVAINGIKNGRLNKTGKIELTNVIEKIPTTEKAEKTYEKFIEDIED